MMSTLRFVVLALLLLSIGACARPPERIKKPGDKGRPENQLEAALDGFRTATRLADYRNVFSLINGQLTKDDRARIGFDIETRKVLDERYNLDDDEVREIDALSFQSLDALHVEFCFQMRDATRPLDTAGLSPLEQAVQCADWVARNVILQERTDEMLPPQAVVQLGLGTARERALVLLALLRQRNIDGCIVALPGSRPEQPGPVLAGALIDTVIGEGEKQRKETEIHLFDPRLGRPLPGPDGKGVATLTQLRKDPKLFWPAGTPAEVKGDPEVLAVPPLTALAPRMKWLGPKLIDRHSVHLSEDPAKLLAHLEAGAGTSKVRVWHCKATSKDGSPVTPVRALRAYVSADEGGIGTPVRAELAKQQAFVSLAGVQANLSAMRLINANELVPDARARLLGSAEKLFEKYVQTPRQLMLRGKVDPAQQRLSILVKPLQDLDLEIAAKRVLEWRDRVNDAYRMKMEHKVWAEDEYFLGLLEGRSDHDTKKVKELTIIMLSALKDPIQRDIDHLQAIGDQEQAAQGGIKTPHRWEAAASAWKKYLGERQRGLAELERVLKALRPLAQNREPASLANLFLGTDQLFVDLHRAMSARFLMAEAQERAGNRAKAVDELTALIADLDELSKHALNRDIAEFLAAARAGNAPVIVQRLESHAKDLGPDGGFAWLRRAAELRLRELGKTA